MGRKQVLSPYKAINAGDMSGALVSNPSNVNAEDKLFVEVEWAGTSPVGEFFVEVASKDKDGNFSTWKALTFESPILISGNTGSHLITLEQIPFEWFRVRYAATSGIGNLTAVIGGKSEGA